MSTSTESVSLGRRLLNGWIAIAGRFGAVQTLVLMALFYVALVGPMAVGTQLARRDFLEKRGLKSGGSAWHDANTGGQDLERAKLTT